MIEIHCEQQNLPARDPNDPSVNLVLEQRTPASSVHIDKGLENQRVRTNASTSALIPLLAVLIAALPVPAHEDFLASVAAVTSLSLPRLSRCIRGYSPHLWQSQVCVLSSVFA